MSFCVCVLYFAFVEQDYFKISVMFVNLGPTNLRARPARIIRRGSDLVFTWEWRLFWALFSSEKDLISSVYPSKVCAYHVLIEVKQLDTKQHCLR